MTTSLKRNCKTIIIVCGFVGAFALSVTARSEDSCDTKQGTLCTSPVAPIECVDKDNNPRTCECVNFSKDNNISYFACKYNDTSTLISPSCDQAQRTWCGVSSTSPIQCTDRNKSQKQFTCTCKKSPNNTNYYYECLP